MVAPRAPSGTVLLVRKPLLCSRGLLLSTVFPVHDVCRFAPGGAIHSPGLKPSPGRSFVLSFCFLPGPSFSPPGWCKFAAVGFLAKREIVETHGNKTNKQTKKTRLFSRVYFLNSTTDTCVLKQNMEEEHKNNTWLSFLGTSSCPSQRELWLLNPLLHSGICSRMWCVVGIGLTSLNSVCVCSIV